MRSAHSSRSASLSLCASASRRIAQVAPSRPNARGTRGSSPPRPRRRRRNRAARRRRRRRDARATATAARRCTSPPIASQHDAMRALVAAGADPNALERRSLRHRHHRRGGERPAHAARPRSSSAAARRNVTSRYDGTALIAAAHLGHVEVVRELIRAGAPLDHVNNLGWTALIESIVLGDGGPRHTATLKALVDAGANVEPRRSQRRDAAAAREEPRLPGNDRAAGEGGGAFRGGLLRTAESAMEFRRRRREPPGHGCGADPHHRRHPGDQ